MRVLACGVTDRTGMCAFRVSSVFGVSAGACARRRNHVHGFWVCTLAGDGPVGPVELGGSGDLLDVREWRWQPARHKRAGSLAGAWLQRCGADGTHARARGRPLPVPNTYRHRKFAVGSLDARGAPGVPGVAVPVLSGGPGGYCDMHFLDPVEGNHPRLVPIGGRSL